MTTKSDPRSVYQIVTERLIEKLEAGVVPWQQPWTKAGIPRNLITGRPYQNINCMLLAMLGYERNLYLTFKQASDIGASIRKGEKSHIVVFWKIVEKTVMEKGEEKKEKKGMLRYYLVFNISQCDNVPEKYIPPLPNPEPNSIHRCAEIVQFMPDRPDIKHDQHRAYYNLSKDYINMPRPETFKSNAAYFGILFHELVHSTGHPNRLNRKEVNEKNMQNYSIEELTAEIGACYLLSVSGIADGQFENNAAYIGNWLKCLKNDRKFIFYASSQAQKATNYILDLSEPEQAPEPIDATITAGAAKEEVLDELPF
jgi:antirestriction protein ArdC